MQNNFVEQGKEKSQLWLILRINKYEKDLFLKKDFFICKIINLFLIVS